MRELLAQLLNLVAKLFGLLFTKSPVTLTPEPVPQPEPVPVPEPTPVPPPPVPPPPAPAAPTQSVWWHGSYAVTQGYGPTNFTGEAPNPHHPGIPHWHDGIDFGMPIGTPLYAGRDCYVVSVGITEFGIPDPAALILWTGSHDIWLLHLNDQANLRHGQFVKTGTLLGHTGNRGNSTGPHLHFQVNPHGGDYLSSVDPHPWLLPFGSPGAANN